MDWTAQECIEEMCTDEDGSNGGGVSCTSNDECGEGQFCYEELCDTCDECHYCHDGPDNTCGSCGAGYPTREAGPCVANANSASQSDEDGSNGGAVSCTSNDECGEGQFCYEELCDTCEECHYCHDGPDNTCGSCGAGYPTREAGPCVANPNSAS